MNFRTALACLGIAPIAALLCLGAMAPAEAQSSGGTSARGTGPFPLIKLPEGGSSGQQALDALGSKLPAVAAWYGKTGEALQQELLRDPNLKIDKAGRLYAVGRVQPNKLLGETPSFPALPLDQTFRLHSKPGAAKTIVLDFRGVTLTRSLWNTSLLPEIKAPAFDMDDQPGLSATERGAIQNIWQRVAEDFAPFDVDVTTERPAPGGLAGKGAAVIVTTEITSFCSCSLAAYVDSFGRGYQAPALVFSKALNQRNVKSIAEAASHAIGRTLGLGRGRPARCRRQVLRPWSQRPGLGPHHGQWLLPGDRLVQRWQLSRRHKHGR